MNTATAPHILSGTPGSFARTVFHDRHPELLRRVIDALPYGPAQQDAIGRLLIETTTGVVEPLAGTEPDRAQWSDWGTGVYGRAWGEVPFLWAESYFYRKLLQATGYFTPGAWHGIDPFAPFKNAELTGPAVTAELAALADLAGLSEERKRDILLTSALWGNRADLGFQLTAPTNDARTGPLVDDSALLWATLTAAHDATVCFVADNAGRELLPDLVLIDHLFGSGLAARVVLYVKPYPYYVSDATMSDVLAAIDRLRATPETRAAEIGTRLRQAMNSGALTVRTHDFCCAPLPYRDLPADLAAEFSGAAMTVLKGDLNYRRLVEDRHWPATTAFADTVRYFPSPVTALRTLKSDVIVGLTADQVAELDADDRHWRTDGTHAVIQIHTR